MKTRPIRSRNGFTLIELLVVISIIIVLAAMSFAAITTVNRKKDALLSKSMVTDLSFALNSYYESYNRLPSVGGSDELTADGQAGVELLKILTGKEDPASDMQNPKGLNFLTTKIGTNKKQGGLIYSGSEVVGMYDAWGQALHIKFDNGSTNEIPDPTKPGDVVRQKRVIVWSFGPDGKVGDNDEVKSW
jgi:prepilin-type N-terminal cleavage/methylation domain-containing protein